MIVPVRWMLFGMAVSIVGASCTQSATSGTGASTSGATTKQVQIAMDAARPEAMRQLNKHVALLERGSYPAFELWMGGDPAPVLEGMRKLRDTMPSVTTDALCSDDHSGTYGWSRYPFKRIHFCDMPVERLGAGWFAHEGSHAILDTKDLAYSAVESQTLPPESARRNAANWAGLISS